MAETKKTTKAAVETVEEIKVVKPEIEEESSEKKDNVVVAGLKKVGSFTKKNWKALAILGGGATAGYLFGKKVGFDKGLSSVVCNTIEVEDVVEVISDAVEDTVEELV